MSVTAGDAAGGGADLGPGARLQVQAVQVVQAAAAMVAPKEPQAAAVFAGTQAGSRPGTGRLHTAHCTPTAPLCMAMNSTSVSFTILTSLFQTSFLWPAYAFTASVYC